MHKAHMREHVLYVVDLICPWCGNAVAVPDPRLVEGDTVVCGECGCDSVLRQEGFARGSAGIWILTTPATH